MTQPNHSLLENMTYLEFEEACKSDPVILIPLGSVEIQGPVAPMGDYMLTKALVDEIAQVSGAIAAPTLPFGYAEYFRPVPGGISLSAKAFRATLKSIINGFLDNGLTKLVILNGHSGNYPLIDQVIRDAKRKKKVLVPCINLWQCIPDEIWAQAHKGRARAAMGHGADPLTSIYMHYFPQLVRMDAYRSSDAEGEMLGLPTMGLSGILFDSVEIKLPVDVTDHTSNGITNSDPRRSSPEAGRLFTQHLIELSSQFIDHIKKTETKL